MIISVKKWLLKPSFGKIEGLFKLINRLTILALPLFLSKNLFGEIGVLVGIINFFNLSFSSSVDKFIFNEKIKNNKNSDIYLRFTFLVFLVIIIGVLLCTLIFDYSNSFIYLLCALSGVLYAMNRIELAKWRYDSLFKKYLLNRTIYQALFVIVIFMGFILYKDKIVYVTASLIPLAILAVFIFIIERKKILKQTINLKKLFPAFIFTLPFFIHSAFKNINSYSDRYLISEFLNDEDLANYVFAYTIASTVSFVFFMINSDFDQKLFKNKFETSFVEKYLKKSLSFTIVGSMVILVFSIVYIYLKPTYTESFIPLILLVPTFYYLGIYQIGVSNLVFVNRKRFIPLITGVSAIINLGLNFFLIRELGLYAGVLANFVSNILLSIFLIEILKIRFVYKFIVYILIVSVIFIIFGYALDSWLFSY